MIAQFAIYNMQLSVRWRIGKSQIDITKGLAGAAQRRQERDLIGEVLGLAQADLDRAGCHGDAILLAAI
jgi:hypothetical protein